LPERAKADAFVLQDDLRSLTGRFPVTRIAHLSDLHVLGSSTSSLWNRLAERRARKVLRAIAAAKERGADHFVFTGDLTELGTASQFEALAAILHAAELDADRVTLVPGNHDAYTFAEGWRAAMDGPLRPYRRASATEPGKVVELGDAVLLPVDVACHQPLGRAAGELSEETARAIELRVRDLSRWGRPIVLALHHPPLPHAWRAWQWVDGLRGHRRLVDVLERFDDTFVLHGHLHYSVEKAVGRDPRPRIFGVTATVDDAHDAPRVRVYAPSAGFASNTLEWRAA
jgi:3',5'-cyclic-AMP phosphodiesterase